MISENKIFNNQIKIMLDGFGWDPQMWAYNLRENFKIAIILILFNINYTKGFISTKIMDDVNKKP